MSHFTVMVVMDTNNQNELAKALQPFHEFECTGTNDEYIQDVNITEETYNSWRGDTTTMLKDPKGNLHEPYSDEFYREPTEEEIKEIGIGGSFETFRGKSYSSKNWGDGKGYRPKIRFIPEGWEEVKITNEESGESFLEFVEGYYGIGGRILDPYEKPDIEGEHKYGYIRRINPDIKSNTGNELVKQEFQVIDRTNPNSKWDWWTVGGIWTGQLKLKELITIEDANSMPDLCGFSINEIRELIKQVQKGNDKILDNFVGKRDELRKAILYYTQRFYQQGQYGEYTGVFNDMNLRDGKIKREEIQPIGYCDAADKKNIDMNGMNQKLIDKAIEEWESFHSKVTDEQSKFVLDTWNERKETKNYDLNKDEVNKILDKAFGGDSFRFAFNSNDFENVAKMTKEEYIECAGTWSPYALLYDGKWYSKGDMGWWRVSTNEESQWKGSFVELWKSIPEDSYITMVDCHI